MVETAGLENRTLRLNLTVDKIPFPSTEVVIYHHSGVCRILHFPASLGHWMDTFMDTSEKHASLRSARPLLEITFLE